MAQASVGYRRGQHRTATQDAGHKPDYDHRDHAAREQLRIDHMLSIFVVKAVRLPTGYTQTARLPSLIQPAMAASNPL